MKKRIITAALSSLSSVPLATLADTSSVTLQGRLDVTFENVRASDSSNGLSTPSRNRVSSNSSMVRFKGEEELAGGLKAIFQIEQGVNMDAGGSSPSTGTFASRNSRVGLTGGWGTVFLGVWDTPYKYSTIDIDPFGAYGMESFEAIIGNGATTSGNAPNTSSFERRQRNSVQYWTPAFSGFQGRVAYGANEERTNTSNPNLYSLAGVYANGPVYLALAYERHNDYQATSKADTGVRGSGAYTFGGATTLALVYERLKYDTAVGDLKRNAWYVSVDHRIGPHAIRAFYARANDGSGGSPAGTTVGQVINGSSTGAKQWTVGYNYAVSKRTDLYAYYTKIDNDRNGIYDFDTNSIGIAGPGADPSGIALGIQHRF